MSIFFCNYNVRSSVGYRFGPNGSTHPCFSSATFLQGAHRDGDKIKLKFKVEKIIKNILNSSLLWNILYSTKISKFPTNHDRKLNFIGTKKL